MRRALAFLAVVALVVIAWIAWKNRAGGGGDASACTFATLEQVDFPGGHITARDKRGSGQDFKIDAHMTTAEKTVACTTGESDDACKERAAKAYGPIPPPADRLEVAISNTSGRIAHVLPSVYITRHSVPHEQQLWVPDTPGAKPANGSGNSFKANFGDAWVAGLIVGPAANGNYLLDVWCSTKDAPMPGTKTTGTNGG